MKKQLLWSKRVNLPRLYLEVTKSSKHISTHWPWKMPLLGVSIKHWNLKYHCRKNSNSNDIKCSYFNSSSFQSFSLLRPRRAAGLVGISDFHSSMFMNTNCVPGNMDPEHEFHLLPRTYVYFSHLTNIYETVLWHVSAWGFH